MKKTSKSAKAKDTTKAAAKKSATGKKKGNSKGCCR